MDYTTYLVHHGIKGMKWGVRRYQNADGTLTEAGRKRYSEKETRDFLRKDVRLSRRDAKAGAKTISEARENKDKDMSSELKSLVKKMTAKEYEAANNFVVKATKDLVEKRSDGNLYMDLAKIEKAWGDSQAITKAYDRFGKATLKSLKLDDKYEFEAVIRNSLGGLFVDFTVYDRQAEADARRLREEDERMRAEARASRKR